MNDSIYDADFQSEPSRFSSEDCVNLIIDGPGDTTVRPPSPLLYQLGLAQRELLERWQHLLNQPPSQDQPPDSSSQEPFDQ